jgi:hypothetical protein
MPDLLAVDPSIESTGVALFRDGRLIAAARIHPRTSDGMTHAQRALAMADAVIGWTIGAKGKISTVAHEWPQIYTGSKSRANPNNLVAMAVVDGAIDCALAFIAAQRGEQLDLRSFLPAEWAGQLPKDTRKGAYWKSPRGVRIWSRLDDAERAVAPDQHDAGDAIGIGLHALGRLGVKRALASR